MLTNEERAVARLNQIDALKDDKRPEIKTQQDIVRVLAQIDPSNTPPRSNVNIKTTMHGSTDKGQGDFAVEAPSTNHGYRDILLDGFTVLKQRIDAIGRYQDNVKPIEINGKVARPARVFADDTVMAMDSLIARLLGGTRNGLFIYWDLSDGYTYKYDIFEHRLTRTKRDADQQINH